MRLLDKNTPCPECGTGMCYVKQFHDGHTNYYCGCRRSVWEEEYYETPCPSCAEKDERIRELEEKLYKDHNNNFEGHECVCEDCERRRKSDGRNS
jgi:hypothetical protein